MKSFACLLVLVAVVVAADRTFDFTPRTNRWVLQEQQPSADLKLKVGLALKTKNPEFMEKMFWAVSTPGSGRFGKHLGQEELRSLFAPSAEIAQTVMNFLTEAGASDVALLETGDFVTASLTVRQIEQIFKTKLGQYTHGKSGVSVIRAVSSYTLPSSISEEVEVIPGLHGFPPSGAKYDNVAVSETAVNVDPDYLYNAYQVTEATAKVKNSSQAVLEFGNADYSASDLQDFFKKYDTVMVGQDILDTYGSNPTPKTSIEANLDVQYIMAMGNFVDTYMYCQPVGNDIIDAFVDYTTLVLSQSNPALVHSISFGEYGGDYDNSTVQYLNTQFQKMGLRGISILLASGDNGVGCSRDCSSFEFDFPSSPYITMVGATEFDSRGTETGATLSSGGFSEDYFRPSYQNVAVNGYFNSGVSLPDSSYYYAQGRAYPDVAAAGVNLRIYNKGKDMAVSGTSCSAPIFAGLIALMNNERMKQGKGSLGFLNPFLYSNPTAFTDITVGNNKDCPYLSGCCCPGFDAYKGWDPVTGLGSPVYPLLLNAALKA